MKAIYMFSGLILLVARICQGWTVTGATFAQILPFMASIETSSYLDPHQNPSSSYCSASVLSNQVLLTSSKCTIAIGAAVRVGKATVEGDKDATVTQVIKYKNPANPRQNVPISLVIIDPPLENAEFVKILLPKLDIDSYQNKHAILTGYRYCGAWNSQRTAKPLIQNRLLSTCTFTKNPLFICSHGPSKCWPGSSGGPLVVWSRTENAYVQVAVDMGPHHTFPNEIVGAVLPVAWIIQKSNLKVQLARKL